MGPEVIIRPATRADAVLLASQLREADKAELRACGHDDGEMQAVVEDSVSISITCFAAFVGDDLACIFGVTAASLMSREGACWMLGTDTLDRHPVKLMKRTSSHLDDMLRMYPRIHNLTDVRNTKTIRWLKRLGFTFFDPIPHPVTGLLFYPFEKRAL